MVYFQLSEAIATLIHIHQASKEAESTGQLVLYISLTQPPAAPSSTMLWVQLADTQCCESHVLLLQRPWWHEPELQDSQKEQSYTFSGVMNTAMA